MCSEVHHAERIAQTELPLVVDLDDACRADRFLLEGAHGNLWFEYRSPTLFVTFDNLATLDDPYPRLPWMHSRVEKLGYSLLGAQTLRKDWFRQPTTPAQIAMLVRNGFFERFEKVVFMGASMGAFAALNYAPLVPGASALVFSPQSTMNREIAPFERRFQYAVRRSNWVGMPFLDAAAAMPYIPQVAMFYDPLAFEDRQHALRLDGPNVQHLAFPFATHQAIRLVVKCDALPQMMREFAETGRLGREFHLNMRTRNKMRSWRRAMIETLQRRNRPEMLRRACSFMLAEKDYLFATKALSALRETNPELFPNTLDDPATLKRLSELQGDAR